MWKHKDKVIGFNKFETENTDEDIVKAIIQQNKLDDENPEINILFKSEAESDRFSLIVEVIEYALKSLINRKKILIGLSKYRALEDYGIVCCYSCRQFGHVANYCKNNITCSVSGKGHLLEKS